MATSCLLILSHSLKAAVKADLPEPAVPMMNTTGICVSPMCDGLCGLGVITFLLLQRFYCSGKANPSYVSGTFGSSLIWESQIIKA